MDEEVFAVAVSLMDRVLSMTSIRKTQLQLLGTACLFVASKLRESLPFDAKKLTVYTNNSISIEELKVRVPF